MRHGVGIVDHIEDRIVGLKVRDIYEVPAAAILLKAHRELERLCGTIHQNQFKPELDRKWAYLVYAGLWWEPLRTDIEAYIRHVNERVTGVDRSEALQGLGPGRDAREPERGLRRPARDLRRVRRAVLPAGVARVHRDLVAAVPDGTPAAERVEPQRMFYKLLGWPSGTAASLPPPQATGRRTLPEAAAGGRRGGGRGRRRAGDGGVEARRDPTAEPEFLARAAAASGTIRPRGRVVRRPCPARPRRRAPSSGCRRAPRAGSCACAAAGPRRRRAEPDLPVLPLRAAGAEHRFDSLPDARFARDPSSWRGTYLVPAELVDVRSRGAVAGVAERRAGRPAAAEPRRRAAAGARRARAARGAGRARRPGDRPRRARRAPRPPRRGRRAGPGARGRRGAEGGRGARAAFRRAGAPPGGGDRRARATPRPRGAARRSPPRWRPPPRCGRARASGGCACGRARSRAPATRSASRCWSPSGRRIGASARLQERGGELEAVRRQLAEATEAATAARAAASGRRPAPRGARVVAG